MYSLVKYLGAVVAVGCWVSCGGSNETFQAPSFRLETLEAKTDENTVTLQVNVCNQGDSAGETSVSFLFGVDTPTCDTRTDHTETVFIAAGACTLVSRSETLPAGVHTAGARLESDCTIGKPLVVESVTFTLTPGSGLLTTEQLREHRFRGQWLALEPLISTLYEATLNGHVLPADAEYVQIASIADIHNRITAKQRQAVAQTISSAAGAVMFSSDRPSIHFVEPEKQDTPFIELTFSIDSGETTSSDLSYRQALDIASQLSEDQRATVQARVFANVAGHSQPVHVNDYSADFRADCDKLVLGGPDQSAIYVLRKVVCFYNMNKQNDAYRDQVTAFLTTDATAQSLVQSHRFEDDRIVLVPNDPNFRRVFDIGLQHADWEILSNAFPLSIVDEQTSRLELSIEQIKSQYDNDKVAGSVVHFVPDGHETLHRSDWFRYKKVRDTVEFLASSFDLDTAPQGIVDRLGIVSKTTRALRALAAPPGSPPVATSGSSQYYNELGAFRGIALTPYTNQVAHWSFYRGIFESLFEKASSLPIFLEIFDGYQLVDSTGSDITFADILNPTAASANTDYLEVLIDILENPDIQVMRVASHGLNGRIGTSIWGPLNGQVAIGNALIGHYSSLYGFSEQTTGDPYVINSFTSFGSGTALVKLGVNWARMMAHHVTAGNKKGVLSLFTCSALETVEGTTQTGVDWSIDDAFYLTMSASGNQLAVFDTFDILQLRHAIRDSTKYLAMSQFGPGVYLNQLLEQWTIKGEILPALNEIAANWEQLRDAAATHNDGTHMVSLRQLRPDANAPNNRNIEPFPKVFGITAGPYDDRVFFEDGVMPSDVTIQFSSLVTAAPVLVETITSAQQPLVSPSKIVISVPEACEATISDMGYAWIDNSFATEQVYQIDGANREFGNNLRIAFDNDTTFVLWRKTAEESHGYRACYEENARPADVQATMNSRNRYLQDVAASSLGELVITIPKGLLKAPNGVDLHGIGFDNTGPGVAIHDFETRFAEKNLSTKFTTPPIASKDVACFGPKWHQYSPGSSGLRIRIPCRPKVTTPVRIGPVAQFSGLETSNHVVAGSRIIFYGGNRLWAMNNSGVTEDLITNAGSPGIEEIIAFDDFAYFSRNHFLWRSDGTPSGTQQVNIPSLTVEGAVPDPQNFNIADGVLHFRHSLDRPGPPPPFGSNTRSGISQVLSTSAGPVVAYGGGAILPLGRSRWWGGPLCLMQIATISIHAQKAASNSIQALV